jgi:hypothetical protein
VDTIHDKNTGENGSFTEFPGPIGLNARGIPSLINILQGIPTEGGSYIHVPCITERRPYMSTHPGFFAVSLDFGLVVFVS